MRGNPPGTFLVRCIAGSIPTHAGKPKYPDAQDIIDRVYPHACGETDAAAQRIDPVGGLSPRMRGNPVFFIETGQNRGSIPTHAGKPLRSESDGTIARVYPHACGEIQAR